MKLPKNIEKIIKDPDLRKKTVEESHFMFFHIYFHHYIEHNTANFQKEMFKLTEDPKTKNIVIVAFRGSGKSTIMNMSFPIWAIMGKLQCKYILIVGLTQEQAKQHLKNIRQELEHNKMLAKDLGPFIEVDNDWSAYTLEIPKYGARISAVSTEQSIRGTRHGAHRPDLIICDDIEDMNSVKNLEIRDKVDDFVTSELIPAGTSKTRLVVIGNLLHEDSFIMRLSKRIRRKEFDGVFRAYPLLDDEDHCLWPGKYPNKESIIAEKRRIGKEPSWQREYMLKIITDTDRIIQPEWIQHYDILPPEGARDPEFRATFTAIDLAVAQTDRADYTAMVTAKVYGYKDQMIIYVMPNPINLRMTTQDMLDTAQRLYGDGSILIVEDVAYQKSAIQQLEDRRCGVISFKPKGDKRARLYLASPIFQSGRILFPEKGCEKLIRQIVNFGSERYDDLVDAVVMLISHAMGEDDMPMHIDASVDWDNTDEDDDPEVRWRKFNYGN
jgi:predicted phage terminase large subunit-like protein